MLLTGWDVVERTDGLSWWMNLDCGYFLLRNKVRAITNNKYNLIIQFFFLPQC